MSVTTRPSHPVQVNEQPSIKVSNWFLLRIFPRSIWAMRTDSANPEKSKSTLETTEDRVMRNVGLLARISMVASLSAPSPLIHTRFVTQTVSPHPLCVPRKRSILSPSEAISTASRIERAWRAVFLFTSAFRRASAMCPSSLLYRSVFMGFLCSSVTSNSAFVGASLPNHASSPADRT